jgi:hypothetical protein
LEAEPESLDEKYGWYARQTPEAKRKFAGRADLERTREKDRKRWRESRHFKDRGRKREGSKAAESRERWRKKNREKVLAHKKVRYAIDHGRLERLPCEVCGRTPAHAHHENYGRPLEVRWLCPWHHREEHAQYLADEGAA